jgi:histidinol-phosphatase (PHP family)
MKQKLFDCHVHSNFSPDSNMKPEDGCVAAIEVGLAGIIFTDHLDFDFPDSKYNIPARSKALDSLITTRSEVIKNLKQKYENQIKILEGIELGIQPHVVKDSEEIIKSFDFDFVICSVHAIDKMDIFSNKFFERKTQKESYQRYLEEVYWIVCNFKDYDIVGHIGYVQRFGNFENREMPYKKYCDIIDAILKKVIADGKGIEVNTSGYRKGLKYPNPNFDIVKRYRELGGEIITLGSDSHDATTIGDRFDIVKTKLKETGFTHVSYFEKRRPVFVKI